MAEAFPEDQNVPDESRRVISVLLLASKWQFDTYGLSTINKSLVNNLRLVDPEGKSIKITYTTLEDDGSIKYDVLKDARKHHVKLNGARRPRGSKKDKKPKVQWLDESIGKYYRYLVHERKYDFIIGHVPYMSNGCFNFKDFCKEINEYPKIVLVFHALPKDENGSVDNDVLEDWLTEADIVFSLGKTIEDELISHISALEPEQRPIHKAYLPSYPLELFAVKQDSTEGKIKGTQNISMMSGEIKDLDINGLNFPLAVTATAGASQHIRDFDNARMRLSILVANAAEKTEWKKHFDEVMLTENMTDTGLSFQAEAPLVMDKMKVYMRKSNLFLLPLKSDSPVFGTEALAAIAAGVPVLVSRDSGLASLLKTMAEDEPVVNKTKSELHWKERIIHKLVKPEEAQIAAKRLREQLLLDTSISQTHLDFINVISGRYDRCFALMKNTDILKKDFFHTSQLLFDHDYKTM